MVDVAHFSLPFRWATPHAAVSEQDTQQEIAECCETIIRYPLGYRPELPDFGCAEVVFGMEPLDVAGIQQALDQWEPRAQALVEEGDFDVEEWAAEITATLGGQP